jgi:nitrite reductase/ring-hydroxylating ferredoxin subunit
VTGTFVDVGAATDFPEGQPRVISVDGRQVGVVLWRSEVFALRNVCPHEYGPVCSGIALPLIVGDGTGEMAVDEDRLVIVCPWHGWEFDVRTGRAAWAAEASYKLKTYPAKLEAGRIMVDTGGGERRSPRGRPGRTAPVT